jgi:hypothetical protein
MQVCLRKIHWKKFIRNFFRKMTKKILDKIVDKIVKSGEKISNLVAVIFISAGINLLTGLATSSAKDIKSIYPLFLVSLFFLCSGILSFLFSARIKNAYEAANRLFLHKYTEEQRKLYTISDISINLMKENEKEIKKNRLIVFFIIFSTILGFFFLFSFFFRLICNYF